MTSTTASRSTTTDSAGPPHAPVAAAASEHTDRHRHTRTERQSLSGGHSHLPSSADRQPTSDGPAAGRSQEARLVVHEDVVGCRGEQRPWDIIINHQPSTIKQNPTLPLFATQRNATLTLHGPCRSVGDRSQSLVEGQEGAQAALHCNTQHKQGKSGQVKVGLG